MNAYNELSANYIKRLMRAHKKTINGLAEQMGITQTRVRYVREHGVRGEAFVHDWLFWLCQSTQPKA